MEEHILNYLPTVMFCGTPCILKPLVIRAPGQYKTRIYTGSFIIH